MSNPEIKVYVTVSTENGTHQCSRKYHDGNVGNIESTLGQFNVLSVEVEKKLFLHQKGQCRMRPYSDLFNGKANQSECIFACQMKNQSNVMNVKHWVRVIFASRIYHPLEHRITL